MRPLAIGLFALLLPVPASSVRDASGEVCFSMLEMFNVRQHYDGAIGEANRLRQENEELRKEVKKLRLTLST